MGGCLPMLLQFPILMALFMFVPSAIELRQQSFLWADDLFYLWMRSSHSHSIFRSWATTLAVLLADDGDQHLEHEVYDVYAGYRSAATNGGYEMDDVSDADYVLVVLNDYPSGLNYYYFVSTLISVGTMILLRKTTDETKLLAILEAKKKARNK